MKLNLDLIEGQADYDFLDQVMMVQVLHQIQMVYMEYPMFLKHN